MDINIRYTYENQYITAYLLNWQGKSRYSEPIVNYIWNSGRRWWLNIGTVMERRLRQTNIKNELYYTVGRNSYGGNWQNVSSAEQSSYWIGVSYNNLSEVGSWIAGHDVT